jgi:hypothetical protein
LVLLFAGAVLTTQRVSIIAVLAIGYAVLASAIMVKWAIDQQIAAISRSQTGQVYTCTMSEDGWTYTDKHGLRTSVPWRIMDLAAETEDVWMISAAGLEIFILRKPLREAGLEGLFQSRMQSAQSNQRT